MSVRYVNHVCNQYVTFPIEAAQEREPGRSVLRIGEIKVSK